MTATRDARDMLFNHEEAKELAQIKQFDSNLARCYLALESRLAKAEKVVEAARGIIDIYDAVQIDKMRDALREYDAQGGGEGNE